ncbi:hypothetical protein SHI21_07425 [Bacteriovorax sp. PP10]|uniref:Uncharacterized protein n=1 Tax=Bacteriovorax antarcticus TaxID=3088717 RepID=A0ABU5VUJ0_9BACT|nr:hypothetical protein [Bacteriovorax sp. PP10]MEA9356024.1 hypothetical protein [Bacteriovorax sp. PP10]
MHKIFFGSRSQSGNMLVYMVVILAIITGLFVWNQQRSTNVMKSINKTINSYTVDAKLLEVRSFLTNVAICESSLKGQAIDQPGVFTLRSASGIIDINFPDDDLKVTKYQFVPVAGGLSEVMSAQINVTIQSIVNTKKVENVYSVNYNFIVDTSTRAIKECLGEKTEESDELFKTTVAQKREDICKDALKGTIQNGKCVWPW